MLLLLAAALAGCQAGDAAPQSAPGADTFVVPPNYARTPAPEQPVPFSHAMHAGTLGLPCANCHAGADPAGQDDPRTEGGAHMTLPELSTCMNCHAGVAVDRPAIQRLAQYRDSATAVPWVRVYRVLEGVNWSHKPHLDSGMSCQTCHGDVAAMDVMSMTTAVTAMGSCIGCHRSGQANPECVACHSWPGASLP